MASPEPGIAPAGCRTKRSFSRRKAWPSATANPSRCRPAGAPFEGYRWRTAPELNVNYVWLYVYSQQPEGHRIRVWYNDVVVATEFIGPLVGK